MKKIKKFIKNKKAQSAVEFCLAIPVVLLLTLGAVDVAKANIIRLENTQAMQMYLSKVAADNNAQNTPAKILGATGSYIQQTSMYCTRVEGASHQTPCNGKNPVVTKLRLEKAASSTEIKAGTQICMAAKSEYKPYYSGIYSGGTMKIYSRACSLMETNKPNTGAWQPIALGEW